ncbi:hypothetical protein [Pantoea agglomerans]|uniref:hypothetical protein n=2 Tax=Gammaproteobacteria TaxID=1236 RepID=UPI002B1E15AF|nr:hypothetical protein [Pantoea agglomerans]
MSGLVSQILRTQAFFGLTSSSKIDRNFKWWLESGNYSFNSSPSGRLFSISTTNPEDVIRPLCHDIARFASSSLESITNIDNDPEFPKSNGWMSIRIYYGAFFAAHSLLRVFGESCSYLNNNSIREVNKVLKKQLPSSQMIRAGNYSIKLSRQSGGVQLDANEIDSSHAGLWDCFYDLLTNLENSIALTTLFTTEQKNECVSFLAELKKRISRGGNKSFLSLVRNEINYNHAMNCWSSYQSEKKSDTNIIKLASQKWVKTCSSELFSHSAKEKVDFAETCAIIISLMKDMMIEINSINKSSFLRYTTIPTLRKFTSV